MFQLMHGNQACVEGALAAGCRFFAGYPITPATEIAEAMSVRLPQVEGKFIQMEDEIASLAAVIGASLGGLKAMTATSGPGFSLMQECIGYAAMTEIPCVIVNVQRGGPGTGQPTGPSQGDVMQTCWGTHGDHPIIVLSPSSVGETFDLAVTAFNLSEKYRTPVILLSDEAVAHIREKVELPPPHTVEVVERIRPTVPPEWYLPYDETISDVAPMASFGEGYRYHVTGLLHDPAGFPTTRPDEIQALMTRLARKIDRNLGDILRYQQEDMEDATRAVVAYGITTRAARHAVKMARAKGLKAGLVKLMTLWPFPEELISRVADQVGKILVPEMNQGQLVREVQRVVQGKTRVQPINRVDGELITPGQILEAIEGLYR